MTDDDPPWPFESDEQPVSRSINSDLAKRLRTSYYAKPKAERDEI
jgi:hypothetical protein